LLQRTGLKPYSETFIQTVRTIEDNLNKQKNKRNLNNVMKLM